MKFETKVPSVTLNHRFYMKWLKDHIQDGGGRHLEIRISAVAFEPMDGFSEKFKSG